MCFFHGLNLFPYSWTVYENRVNVSGSKEVRVGLGVRERIHDSTSLNKTKNEKTKGSE